MRKPRSEYKSQGGQDVWIDRLFSSQRGLVYLDLGCNDGVTDSNT